MVIALILAWIIVVLGCLFVIGSTVLNRFEPESGLPTAIIFVGFLLFEYFPILFIITRYQF